MNKRVVKDQLIEKRRYDDRANEFSKFQKTLSDISNFEIVSNASDPKYEAILKYRDVIQSTIRTGWKVLELGAGMGENTEPLTKRDCEVYLLDISEASLNVAKSKWGEQVNIVVGSIEEIPFPDSYFDLVVGAGCLSYGDPKRVDEEVSRVLKSGGSLVLVDSLNHNPIYILNRIRHFIVGNRSLSTLLRIPRMNRIDTYRPLFQEFNVMFFGKFLWFQSLTKILFGDCIANKFYAFLENKTKNDKLAFKFVCIGKNLNVSVEK